MTVQFPTSRRPKSRRKGNSSWGEWTQYRFLALSFFHESVLFWRKRFQKRFWKNATENFRKRFYLKENETDILRMRFWLN